MEIEWVTVLGLFLVAMLAGAVDAIAGGGGLLAIPVLLLVLDDPVAALATNKIQGVCASFTAFAVYYRQGLVNINTMRVPAVMSCIGGVLGTLVVTQVSTSGLQLILPILLLLMTLYFLFSPSVSDVARPQLLSYGVFGLSAAVMIGFYDGFFGPGTGSFFVMAGLVLLGLSAMQAIANAKLLNLASNMGALLIFIIGGHVVWLVGGIMALGQILGAGLGARLAVYQGKRLVKPVLVTVTLLMSIKLGWQQYGEYLMHVTLAAL